jgi:hypothetical protein
MGTYGDSCTTCATTGCTDNCRYSDGCEHCENRLCETCETFAPNAVCLSCKANTLSFDSVEPDDCECDADHVEDTATNECTCATGCATCTGLLRTECKTCDTDYYLLHDTEICVQYCPQGTTKS